MCKWFDFFDGVATELFANHFEFFIKARCTNCDVCRLLLHQFDQTHPRSLGIAVLG